LVSNTLCGIQFGRHKCIPSAFTYFNAIEKVITFFRSLYYQFYYYLYVSYLNCLCFPNGEFAVQKKRSQENKTGFDVAQ